MYPLRLEVAPFLEEVSSQAMAKKASGKRLTIRAPGRRRYQPGPRPKGKGKDKDKDKNLEARSQRTNHKMIKKAKHFSDEDNLIKKAFQGWKRLHYEHSKFGEKIWFKGLTLRSKRS